jgi:ubiquinone biosynthesis protein
MGPSTAIGRTLFQAQRTREILTVLIRYGFANVVRDLGLDRLIERGRQLLGRTPQADEARREPQQVRLRKAMESLGPTFIKMGQVLSMRPDLIPPAWAEEFAKLQDEVPPAEPEAVKARLREEFGDQFDTLFTQFEAEPFAAASIAQTHNATLASGESVVLKVLRPGIHDIIHADMSILRTLAGWAESYFAELGYSPVEVVDQFDRELRKEIDLRHEARSAERMAESFKDNPNVLFPGVYWDTTTENVLTMQRIEGTPLSKVAPEQFTKGQRHDMVAYGADAVFRQCLEIGFFHADPHPGNIIALDDARICFVDCGMVGHIDPGTQQQLADLVHGVLEGELDRVVEITLSLADADPNLIEERTVRADVWEFISHFQTTRLDQLDIGQMLQEFFQKIRRHHLQCPADLVFLIKALTTIEGVGERFAPEFDLVGHVRPHVERLLKRRYGVSALRRRMRRAMMEYAELAETMPRQLQSVVYALRRNRMTVNLEHRGLDRLTHTIEHASRNIASALILAALLVGSSILILADSAAGGRTVLTYLGAGGFIISLGVSATMLVFAWLRAR